MSISNEEKLKMFETEAEENAKIACSEIEAEINSEMKSKLEEAEKNLSDETAAFVQNEILKIRRAKALELSRENVRVRSEFLAFCDSVKADVMENVVLKLTGFVNTGEYSGYLLRSAEIAIKERGGEIDVFHREADSALMEKLAPKIRALAPEGSKIHFLPDSAIKLGGLRFYDKKARILINDIFDEKLKRSEELLNSLMAPVSKKMD